MNSTTKKAAGGVLLSLANVQRNYEQGGSVIEVLRDASLEVRGGEITALVGPPGPANPRFSTLPACWKSRAAAK